MKYKVSVEKYLYCSGIVTVACEDPDDAIDEVDRMISTGKLRTIDVEWDEPVYEDLSFGTTGDVDLHQDSNV